METNDDNQDAREGGTVKAHRRELSWGIVLPVAAMAVTLITWSHTVFVDIVDRIVTIDRIVASNTTAHLKRDTEIQQLGTRFTRIEDEVSECAERVAELRAMSHRWTVDDN